jgi:hypothetical protein
MIAIVVLGALGGRYIDNKTTYDFPIFTLILTVFSVFVSLYVTIKQIIKK